MDETTLRSLVWYVTEHKGLIRPPIAKQQLSKKFPQALHFASTGARGGGGISR